jgi:proline racemase
MAPQGKPTEFSLEAPAGLIRISASCANGKAVAVSFTNVPSFCGPRDVMVRVPTLANLVKVDLCYGGMWYAVVDLDDPHNATVPELRALAGLLPRQGGEIVRLGEMIKVATREQSPVRHPVLDDAGPTIMVFRCRPSAEARAHGVHARNAVVMSTGALDWARPETWKGNIDRSPCGTGTCAVMALLAARGELCEGEDFVHESVLGSRFTGRIVGRATVGPHPAIVPQITGSAVVTQVSQVVVDPEDPFPEGYTVSDIWADSGNVQLRNKQV